MRLIFTLDGERGGGRKLDGQCDRNRPGGNLLQRRDGDDLLDGQSARRRRRSSPPLTPAIRLADFDEGLVGGVAEFSRAGRAVKVEHSAIRGGKTGAGMADKLALEFDADDFR